MDDQVLLRFLGRLHPLVVHFPIALVLMATLLESALALRRRHRVSTTALTCLAFGAVMAGVAAWFGWLNAAHETFGPAQSFTVLLHRWIGVAAASVAVVAVVLGFGAWRSQTDWVLNGYRGMLILAAILVGVGGHFGTELVHGRNYLSSVFQTPSPAEVVPVRTPAPSRMPTAPAITARTVDFATDVRPILVEHCVHCHGSQRQRAGLVLVPIEATLARTGDGRVIVPGDPDGSPLLRRIRHPADHPDLMPADDDPLPEEKVAILVKWVEEGAAVLPQERPRSEVAVQPDQTSWSIELAPGQRAARDRAIDAIEGRGGLALPVSADGDAIDVNLGVVTPLVRDDDLALLAGLEGCLVQLNLSRTGVTDEGLAGLAALRELRRLRLDHTAVTDAGLVHLDGLEQLTDLNLYGTDVGDAGLEIVARLPRLERLYVGGTRVSAAAVEAMRVDRPEVLIVRDPPILPPEETVAETDDP